MHGLSDNSVEISLLRVHLAYVFYGFALANIYHPLVLNGGRLGTSIMVHLNKIADSNQNCRFRNISVMITQVDVFATWVCMFQELNTIPNPPEKFRKQLSNKNILYTRRLVVYRNQR